MKLSKWVPRAVAEDVKRKLNPQEEVELPMAEERVDYQTKGDHDEP